MKLIAHRGNINGSNKLEENKPEYVENAISVGFDVEIDIWYNTNENNFYLGHDNPQYVVTKHWLELNINKLWIHCKNLEALYHFVNTTNGYNYFWHQQDDFTLTSKNYIWTYPGKLHTKSSVIVMPEWDDINWDNFKSINCFGICTDYVNNLK
jgi:hypothetical protein